MMAGIRPGYKFSIRGDFLGLTGNEGLETETLKVAAELKQQVRQNEWNHRVKLEAVNRYSDNGDGVEIIVLPNVVQYRNLAPGDVEGILRKHLTECRETPINKDSASPAR